MHSEQNKRKFPRAQYPCFLTIWQGKDYGTVKANMANIGAGGVLVHLEESLMIGAKVEIKIDLSKEESFQCTGLVMRSSQNREDPEEFTAPYSVAIAFQGLDESKVSFLNQLVEKLLNSESNN